MFFEEKPIGANVEVSIVTTNSKGYDLLAVLE